VLFGYDTISITKLNIEFRLANNDLEMSPLRKVKKTRHCEARSNLIILVICILRFPHFVRNDENPLFGVDSEI